MGARSLKKRISITVFLSALFLFWSSLERIWALPGLERRPGLLTDYVFSPSRLFPDIHLGFPSSISQPGLAPLLGEGKGKKLAAGLEIFARQGEESSKSQEQLFRWGGSFLVDYRSFLPSSGNYSFKEYRVELHGDAGTDKTRFHSTLWVRSLGFSTVTNSQTLFVREKVTPFEAQLREAYVDFYGFPFPWLDLRIGRQRIAWGTADRVNPTDNLNPDDLEDIWDFGRHLGSDAIKATAYLGNFTLTGVIIPTFTPASPPLPDWASAVIPPLSVNGLTIHQVTDEIILPARNWRASSTSGIKAAANFLGYDFSLSYVRGRDDLPLIKDVFVESFQAQAADVFVRLVYPRMNILGMDLAGAIKNVGIWAEAAIFFPERIQGELVFPVPGFGLVRQTTIPLSNQAYTKWVVGADYTFGWGLYLNWQLAHGFLHERGAAELGNYFLFNIEWRLLHDKLKLIPFAGCLELRDWSNLREQFAFVFMPAVEYHPGQNAEFMAGVRLIDGRGNTNFSRLKDRDEIFFRMKYSF